MIKVMIIDDQPTMILGLEMMVDDTGIARVIATETDGQAAISSALLHRPDLIMTDVSMPGMNGMEIAKTLVSEWPEAVIVAISAHADELYVGGMIAAGARGYILKDHVSEELCQAMQTILQGDIWIGQDLHHQSGSSL